MKPPPWLMDLGRDILRQVWDQYGAFAVILILFLIYHEWSMNKMWKARLADKDKEIDRLVVQRNRLESEILSKRLTSDRKPGKK
jgi:hypothetical protein